MFTPALPVVTHIHSIDIRLGGHIESILQAIGEISGDIADIPTTITKQAVKGLYDSDRLEVFSAQHAFIGEPP